MMHILLQKDMEHPNNSCVILSCSDMVNHMSVERKLSGKNNSTVGNYLCVINSEELIPSAKITSMISMPNCLDLEKRKIFFRSHGCEVISANFNNIESNKLKSHVEIVISDSEDDSPEKKLINESCHTVTGQSDALTTERRSLQNVMEISTNVKVLENHSQSFVNKNVDIGFDSSDQDHSVSELELSTSSNEDAPEVITISDDPSDNSQSSIIDQDDGDAEHAEENITSQNQNAIISSGDSEEKKDNETIEGSCVKQIKIPCLQQYSDLEKMCIAENLKMCKFGGSSSESDSETDSHEELESDDEYEVEAIMDYSSDKDTHWYYVKWKDWGEEFNTWEPREHLTGCKDLIKAFHWKPKKYRYSKRKSLEDQPIKTLHKNDKLKTFIMEMCKPSSDDIGTLLKLVGISLKEFSTHRNSSLLKRKLREMVSDSCAESGKLLRNVCIKKLKIEDKFGSEDELLTFANHRKVLLRSLKWWEREMNMLSTEGITISVENHVDLEGPPQNFCYITDYKPGIGINIPDDPLVGCECDNCFDDKRSCCASQSGGIFAYNRQGILNVPKGTPIYECNWRCKCNKDCPNRVVQKGSKLHLAIFRTDDGRGWGVKTLSRIKKGSFVMEYFGEVITNEEAERRGKIYDAQGQTYLFDLDFTDSECVYSVDAAHYGNIAHFMNHSCDPNLEVYAVWINNLDHSLHRIAFFARREIKRGEELTFDYQMSAASEVPSPSSKMNLVSNEQGIKRIPCKCGSSSCKKYLF